MLTALLGDLKSSLDDFEAEQVVIFPPSVYLERVGQLLKQTTIQWGGQNVSQFKEGAYTGEVSAAMLADLGCWYTLVGHSERRQLFAEGDALVAEKFMRAQKHGLTPVLCIGESEAEYDAGHTDRVLSRQLEAVLDHEEGGIAAFKNAVIAYEPVWAIGTGKTPTPDEVQWVHAKLRNKLMRMDESIGQDVRIIYGGSVKPTNAAALFAKPDVDGGLVGGASLKANDFIEIAKCIK